MIYLVKVKVNLKTMAEFGQKLQKNELDRSCIKGETFCIKDDPAVGFSYWEVNNTSEFEKKFNPWKSYYESTEIIEVITPQEAMKALTVRIEK